MATKLESIDLSVTLRLAQRIRDEMINELARRGIKLETYNEKGEIIVGLSPFQNQAFDAIILTALRGNEEIGILMSRQCGKTENLIMSVLVLVILNFEVFKRNYSVGIFAPARSQAIEVDRERLRERVMQLDDYLKARGIAHDDTIGKTTKNFYFYYPTGPLVFRVRMESADPEANIKGSTLNLIVGEQTEDMDESKLKNDIMPMGAAVRGSRVFTGTPTTGINNPYFYDLCTKKYMQQYVLKVDYKEAGKWRPNYLQFIEAEKERLGEDDPAFRAQYGLEWIPGLAKFTDLAEINLHQMDYSFDLIYRRRAMGTDWAKSADDTYCAVMERCSDPNHPGLHVIALLEEHGVDYSVQMPDIVEFAKLWRVTYTCDDAVGAGDPNNEKLALSLRGVSVVEGLELNTTLNDNTSNLFAREWHDKRIWLPRPETFDLPCYTAILQPEERQNQKKHLKKLINQLCDLDRIYKANKLNLAHPEGNYHDDCVKSIVYCTWGAVRLPTSTQPAAYGAVDTQPKKLASENEAVEEYARMIMKPQSQWGEV